MGTQVKEGSAIMYIGRDAGNGKRVASKGWEDRMGLTAKVTQDSCLECETIPVRFYEEGAVCYVCPSSLFIHPDNLVDY